MTNTTMSNLTAIEISCAMALILQNVEEHVDIMGFSEKFTPLKIDKNRRLDDNLRCISNLPFNRTDISIPFTWAQKHKKKYDCIIVFTDNETNCNTINPTTAYRKYKTKMNIPNTKLIVCALASNGFTIADPDDPGMLDICGFDASVPDVINEFLCFDNIF
jgi:60 kDa SS-A/Ro ribonucleoprotein